MLFVLSGEVQIGKTRWLSTLTEDLEAQGIVCIGVLSPGIWREHPNAGDGVPFYEKLGIDTVLLPQGERLPFALRRDLTDGRPDEDGESTHEADKAGLGWAILDGTIEKVNAHFDRLAKQAADTNGLPDGSNLLVVDELGVLELVRGGGFTSAVRMLEQGPQPGWPNALIVVRDQLAGTALDRLAPYWDDVLTIGPDDEGRASVWRYVNGNGEGGVRGVRGVRGTGGRFSCVRSRTQENRPPVFVTPPVPLTPLTPPVFTRYANGIVSAALVLFFLVHAALGSISLLHPIPHPLAVLVWAGAGLIGVHLVLCVITSRQMLTDKKRPPSKKKKNHLLLKWLSGLLFLIVAGLHVSGSLGYSAFDDNTKLAIMLALIASLALHTFVGVKSLLKDLDLKRRLRTPVRMVVCAVSLVVASAIVFARLL